MAEIKKINTELQPIDKLLDTSGDAGTSGQILSTTGSGTNWIDNTGGGGTVTGSGATNRVAFWSDTTVLSSDYLFKWDDSNNRLGIGTESPAQSLHIVSTDGANIILNSNTGAENSGIWMTEAAAASPYTNGAYVYYDGTNNAFKINTGTTTLSTRFTIDRDTGVTTFAKNVIISTTDATAPGNLLTLYNTQNGGGASILFSDQNSSAQKGNLTFYHSDGASQGGGASFHFTSTESNIAVISGDSSNNGRFLSKSLTSNSLADFSFVDDPNTGMLRPGADALRFVTGGTAALELDSSQNATFAGNVKVDVYNGGTGGGIFFRYSEASNAYNLSLTLYDDGDGSPDALDINAYDGIYFNTGANTRQNRGYVNSSGDWFFLGDGTFSGDISIPVAKKLYFGGGNHTYIGEDIDDRLRFFTGGAEFMRFTEDTADTVHFFVKTIIEDDLEVDGDVTVGTYSSTGTSRLDLVADAQHDTTLGFFEDNANYGFSFNYDGGENDFYVKRHENDAAGTSVITLYRENDNVLFAGDITIGGGDLTVGGSTRSEINMPRTSANYINASNATGYLVFRTAAGGTALTLTSGQDATFAGEVKIEMAGPKLQLKPTTQNNASIIELGVLNSGTNAYARIDAINLSNHDSNLRFYTNPASSTTQTLALTLDANQDATFAGNVTATQVTVPTYFNATSTSAVLGATGSGNIYLRPNGIGQSSGQLHIATSGLATFSGQVASAATSASDGNTILTTKGYVDGLITGATLYQDPWDARTSAEGGSGAGGNPDLTTGSDGTSPKINGYYFIVSNAGSATPNGPNTTPNSWHVGDWVIWNDHSGSAEWQKIDNSSVLSGVGTGQTVALWQGTNAVTDSETLGNAPITFSTNDATFAGDIAVTGNVDVNAGEVQMDDNYSIQWGGNAILKHTGSQTYLGDNSSSTVLTLASGDATFAGTITSAGLTVDGAVNLDVMPTHESEGIIKIGRYDANTSRYNDIKSYVSSTAASNYLKFCLHNGTVNTVVDVLTLKGDQSATFAGNK